MLADFYIPRLSNNMKIAVQKNNLGVKFGTEVWTLIKNGVNFIFCGLSRGHPSSNHQKSFLPAAD